MGILKKMQSVHMFFKPKPFVQQVNFEECYHYFFIHIQDFVSALINESTAQEKVLLEIFKEFVKRRKKRGYDIDGYDIEESTKQELYLLTREKCLGYIQDNPGVNETVATLLQTGTTESIKIYLQGVQVKTEKHREFINTIRSLVLNKKKNQKVS